MTSRKPLLMTALSLGSVAVLMIAPVARAEGDGHDGPGGHREFEVRQQNRQEDRREDRREDRPVAIGMVDRLVNALNNQVALLEKQDFDDNDRHFDRNDDDGVLHDAVDIDHVRVISLATLNSHLSAANATRVSVAVNANTAALQAFLSGGTDNATAVDAALAAEGVDQSAALAILPFGDDHLLVFTA